MKQRLIRLLIRWLEKLTGARVSLVPGVDQARYERTLQLVREYEGFPQGGEWKRRQVYATLLREYPTLPRSVLAHGIEVAVLAMKREQ